MKTAALLLAALTTPAMAAPEVVLFDPSAPFNPATGIIDLIDSDPTAPDIRLSYFVVDPGGGSNATVWHPQIIGAGWSPFGGNGLEVESSIISGEYLAAGTVVPTATPGPWGVAQQDVYYGAGPANYPLTHIGYEVFPFKDTCLSCSYLVDFLTIDAGRYYVAMRWEDNAQTYYGWVAFDVAYLAYPPSCIYDDGWSCDGRDLESLRQLGLRYVAAGWETEPGTPITAGGGLCRADMNFDARINFFDISEFIARYLAGDPAADYTDDGSFNFFDVSAFIDEYNAGCSF